MLKTKFLWCFVLVFFGAGVTYGYNPNAVQITADTSSFSNNLSSADTTVQHALNTLDGFNAAKVTSTDDTTTNTIYYPLVHVGTGTGAVKTSSSKLTYNPSTGAFAATLFSGSGASLTSMTKSQVGLGNVDNTSDANKPVSSATQTALDAKVTANSAVSGATNTKITYDSKGLVTAGAAATTADIADSANKRYVTDANLVVIGNTSGTNTGDQTTTDDVTTNANYYPVFQTGTGTSGFRVCSTKWRFNPSLGMWGFGTNSPQAQIDVTINKQKTATAEDTCMYIGKTSESNNYATLAIAMAGGAAAANRYWAWQTIEQGVANAGAIVFQQNGGNVSIGTNAPSAQLHTTGTVRFQNFGAGAATFDANGNISSASDERLKDIDCNYEVGLTQVLGLNPIQYHWNKQSGLDMVNTYTGFSAQNVRRYLPEAVSIDSKGYYNLQDRVVVAALVNAIKELVAEIDGIKISLGLTVGDRTPTDKSIYLADVTKSAICREKIECGELEDVSSFNIRGVEVLNKGITKEGDKYYRLETEDEAKARYELVNQN